MSTPPPASTPRPTHRDLGAWFHAHQTEALAGGVALAAALALIMRRRGSGAASSASSGQTAGVGDGGTTSTYGGAGYYDSTATDLYNALTPQLADLQRQITSLQPSAATPATSGSAPYKPGFYTVGSDVHTWGDIAANRATMFTGQSRAASLTDLAGLNPSLGVANGAAAPKVGTQIRIF
jgi:hypothetical protein